MSRLDNDFENYLTSHTSPEDKVLAELTRVTNLTTYNPRMLSGRQQGLFLQFICRMLKPERVLEIGTFTGYSAICLARGIMPNGHLDTIEVNDELRDLILKYFKLAKVEDNITLHLGNALKIIPSLNQEYDMVYIDGDKREYPEYYKIIQPLVKTGGFIIADNVLWNGKVTDPNSNDQHTRAISEFNDLVQHDDSVENVLLPIRDGLMVIRKF
jgi:predicted O-methyltransferase YrrM